MATLSHKITISLLLILTLTFSVFSEAKVTVYAASSMTNVMDALIDDFTQQHSIKVIPVYAGSSSLARQIERGAPADLFISANQLWMQHLVKVGKVDQSKVSLLAANQLVVIAPESSSINTFDLGDKTQWQSNLAGGRLAIGNPTSVPVGIYSKQALESLGVWKSINRLLAPTNNVRVALTLVERAEAPLGMVYRTDAILSSKVKVVSVLNENMHTPIVYPVAMLSTSAEAMLFAEYLASVKAAEILASFGFIEPTLKSDE
ncbi:molybdate ABC transporter substrate-binding protein [Vibrio sp. 10N.286.49.B3]|uniref:molybdate ABC transporter substrate-binding protein n=1 Tax=Vibrio sp. 10N.286.49.B3 TaxID=1880855 RepID=UPI000C831016|nr:molybdate ABC transporter substrate-binding protein [Vibrio sp. 10N.286.49.B3]PMH41397.1 molybdate ABC transporter substrate-binding protein [Vibrio sp. 10N.286.49.B3]